MNKQDPTDQAANRRSAQRTLDRRIDAAGSRIKRLVRSLEATRRTQVQIVNNGLSFNAQTKILYDYSITDQELATLNREIVDILNEFLLQTQTNEIPFNWYWEGEIEPPFRAGAADEARDFNQELIAVIIAGTVPTPRAVEPVGTVPTPRAVEPDPVPFENIVRSQGYQQALNAAYIRNFGVIKGLSDRTAAQINTQINNGIESKLSRQAIVNLITERLEVAKSSAKRIAETEVNRAYNDSRMQTTDILAAETGLRSAVLHISALLPTTRQSHAARHGNVYTVQAQTDWWNSGSNRINCKCSVRSVFIDRDGRIVNKDMQQELKSERVEFFGIDS